MPPNPPVVRNTFKAIANVDVDMLSNLTDAEIRPILPCLVRMSLCPPLDSSDKWTQRRKIILKCLSGLEVVNSLVGLLSIDFYALEQDARKEQQLRTKIGSTQSESVLISQLTQSVALEFERSDAARKLRLLLSELLFVASQIKDPHGDFYQKSSELFENEVFLEEVSDVLCIAQAELPSLLPVTDVAEALLHLPNGVWLLCRLAANVPDAFEEICEHLVVNGEQQDEETVGGRKRAEALRGLCDVNPQHALNVRTLCVEHCRMPGLALALTLHYGKEITRSAQNNSILSDTVAFVSGLLLGNNTEVRTWFAHFVKSGQKKKFDTTLNTLRQELLQEFTQLLPEGTTENIAEAYVVQGCAFIRLYCALKGLATLKFHDTEVHYLLQLITCHPPRTAAGVRFASMALCMVLACPSLLGTVEQDRQVADWLRWLVREVSSYEKETGVKASFGEMLLLIAIHFHSGQTHAIADLVCSTLGMKIPVKANSLARMKTLFIQEIFTEKVVASHAVGVSITKELSANLSGYLPVHCIYQLLKSRAFSKHKVPIKDWIFSQICHCTTPLHPLLPPLIEVFINSIVLPSTKTDRTNEPISETEILQVFKYSVFTKHLGKGGEDLMNMSKQDGKIKHIGKKKKDKISADMEDVFTPQLLMMYYVLLYQDTIVSNMKTITASNRKVENYPPQMIAQLPMKYLLLQAQKEQQQYAGLFSPLLRLLATHYPHLCMVEDWLDEELAAASVVTGPAIKVPHLTCQTLSQAFSSVESNPSVLLLLLEQLVTMAPIDLVPFAEVFIRKLPHLLPASLPRRVTDIAKQIWIKLNTVMPRKLRVMTVNALRSSQNGTFKMPEYSEDDITVDPLIVLRCDDRVFRCPALLQVNLRVLEAFLQASKCYLANHILTTPGQDKQGASIVEREELRGALVAAQESAAIQVLLECCLSNGHDQKTTLLGDLREVQCLVCSFLHQKFIADPNLAKLVHFQGYPRELLPVTVAGIPSMHICLDFIPELLSQPHLDKQIFAVELVSYLSVQYALPKSLSIAKLAVNVMNTLITILPSDIRGEFFQPTLPALVRICRAFPPLCDDAVHVLTQLGRVCTAHLAAATNTIPSDSMGGAGDGTDTMPREGKIKPRAHSTQLPQHRQLLHSVHKTFANIVGSTALLKPLLPSES